MDLVITDFYTAAPTEEKFSLDPAIFELEYNEPLVHQVIEAFRAGARQGSKQNKSRSDVSGGGRKPWAQKGSGRARAGTSRSPLWRKGGVTFAARPRDFSQKVNRKMYRKALACMLAEQFRLGHVFVANNIDGPSRKTKDFVACFQRHGWDQVTIISNEISENLYFGIRNIPRVYLLDSSSVNPLVLFQSERLLFSVEALSAIQEQLL